MPPQAPIIRIIVIKVEEKVLKNSTLKKRISTASYCVGLSFKCWWRFWSLKSPKKHFCQHTFFTKIDGAFRTLKRSEMLEHSKGKRVSQRFSLSNTMNSLTSEPNRRTSTSDRRSSELERTREGRRISNPAFNNPQQKKRFSS